MEDKEPCLKDSQSQTLVVPALDDDKPEVTLPNQYTLQSQRNKRIYTNNKITKEDTIKKRIVEFHKDDNHLVYSQELACKLESNLNTIKLHCDLGVQKDDTEIGSVIQAVDTNQHSIEIPELLTIRTEIEPYLESLKTKLDQLMYSIERLENTQKTILRKLSPTKQTAYTKSEPKGTSESDVQCKRSEQLLASCLNSFYNTIKASSRTSETTTLETDNFEKVLQCSKHFKDYEACIQKKDM
ncbi:hypothetical protein BBOV_III007805 [Babesia bovis T2Bo]|uniref:hypothetical protein n=1 Tax=Babesia bovis T2Bo TaxID=484906 RepID=UPI001C34E38A|nr:hypothetical protein BBOV_III007805 [Babesia bovis T2Bo]KAG6440094.1 hypothetical protein BBOV_III007805 [Babesia bovis T2Bo]